MSKIYIICIKKCYILNNYYIVIYGEMYLFYPNIL